MIKRDIVDLYFNMDPTNNKSGVGVAVGTEIRTGDNEDYFTVINGVMTNTKWELSNDMVAEIEGIEIYLYPDAQNNVYNQLDFVRIEVNGIDVPNINLCELMAPMNSTGRQSNPGPWRDGSTYQNIGLPVLLGHDGTRPTIKLGPGDIVRGHVHNCTATQGGVTINEAMVVRLHVVTAKQKDLDDMFGGAIDQSFGVPGEPIMSKTVGTSIHEWTELHGGEHAARPYVERYITYARNMAATEPHKRYRFDTKDGSVLGDWSELVWVTDDTNAVELTYVGVAEDETNGALNPPNLAWLHLPKGKTLAYCYPHVPYIAVGQYQMPLNRRLVQTFDGPGRLPEPIILQNDTESIEIQDNGTAIQAWQTGPGVKVAVWGRKFYL